MNQHVQDVCGYVSGVACVLGISLSVINAWLTAISLIVAIVAGGITIWPHVQRARRAIAEIFDDEGEPL